MTTLGVYDDRRISLYDNLNIEPTTSSASSHVDYNNCAQQQSIFNVQQQEQQQRQQEEIIKNSELKQVQPQQLSYCNIGSFGAITPIPTTLLASSKAVSIKPTTNNMHSNIEATIHKSSNSNCNNQPQQQQQKEQKFSYVNQHSPTEAYETSQNNIAAVKAALHDAKSKFFGVNDYSLEPENDYNSRQLLLNREQSISKTSTPKKQPTYQNIPENSAIYRQNVTFNANSTKIESAPASEIEIDPIYKTVNSSTFTNNNNDNNNLRMSRTAPNQQTTAVTVHTPGTTTTINTLDQNDQPSQAVYMTTTVPQNIKGSKIAGRHTPTRNSLRHSRMLVVNNRNFQGVEYPNPLNLKQPVFARWMLILDIIIGSLISLLCLWIFLLAPSSYIQHNPYWSGVTLILTGVLGLWLIRFLRIKRRKFREVFFQFLRAFSLLLILLSIVFSLVAFFFAALHYTRLTASDTRCVSKDILVELSSCICTFNTIPSTNGTTQTALNEWKVEYRDLSCKEVSDVLTAILIVSVVLNALGFLANLIYLIMLTFYRHNSKRFYTSV